MIELAEGYWIAPEHISMIKATEENQCLLYTVGQSALDGHVLPFAADEVAEVINDALENVEYEDEQQEEE